MLRREYGNPCSSPKKFILFCRKLLFLESKNINWEANIWFTEGLNISSERYSRSNAVESFSFLDIHSHENRQGLQRYLKYLLTLTSLNLGTIRIHHTYIKEFLRFLEDCGKVITDIDRNSMEEYLKSLSTRRITAQSYNNKLQVISTFLQYLQVTDYIGELGQFDKLNYETIDVFCDWKDAEADRVKLKENAFYSMWNNVEPSLRVLEFPKISDVLIEKYRKKAPNFDIDHEQFQRRMLAYGSMILDNKALLGGPVGARIPDDVELHEYQKP